MHRNHFTVRSVETKHMVQRLTRSLAPHGSMGGGGGCYDWPQIMVTGSKLGSSFTAAAVFLIFSVLTPSLHLSIHPSIILAGSLEKIHPERY